jgi:hypothetical protein
MWPNQNLHHIYNAAIACRSRVTDDFRTSLIGCLDMGMPRLCRDRRDRVFAIRGLLDTETRKHIQPKYTQSVAEVFASAVKGYVETTPDLEILCYCRSAESQTSWPSWVPEWDVALDWWPIGGSTLSWLYTAPGPYPTLARVARVSGDLQTLKIIGIIVDTIHDNNLQRCDEDLIVADDGSRSTWDIKATAERIYAYRTSYDGGQDPLPSRSNPRSSRSQTRKFNKLRSWISTLFNALALDSEAASTESTHASGQTRLRGKLDLIEHPIHVLWSQNGKRFRMFVNRRLLGRSGLLGIAPRNTIPGDVICVLRGLSVPAILRPRPDGAYTFIGMPMFTVSWTAKYWKEYVRVNINGSCF